MVGFETDALKECFDFLDSRDFHKTGRLPLVASRQWKPSWEAEAFRRFRKGLPNLQEVAWPSFYLGAVSSRERELFRAVTLGNPPGGWQAPQRLAPLFQGRGKPRWTVVSRFGRYVLRSHPAEVGESFVYFGDDTLYLMERSRQLLSLLQAETEAPIRCLDLCCGGGGVSLSLPEFAGEVVGVDLNGVAVELAQRAARAQGLLNYDYRCCDAAKGLQERFDLIFGNPPTLSPTLTGQDVFHATGTWDAFEPILDQVCSALSPEGRAVMTLFSEVVGEEDPAWEALRHFLKGRRGFSYRVRREFPLGGSRRLRHCALELFPTGEERQDFIPMASSSFTLPGLSWRRRIG